MRCACMGALACVPSPVLHPPGTCTMMGSVQTCGCRHTHVWPAFPLTPRPPPHALLALSPHELIECLVAAQMNAWDIPAAW
jgi:hypothetical protein